MSDLREGEKKRKREDSRELGNSGEKPESKKTKEKNVSEEFLSETLRKSRDLSLKS